MFFIHFLLFDCDQIERTNLKTGVSGRRNHAMIAAARKPLKGPNQSSLGLGGCEVANSVLERVADAAAEVLHCRDRCQADQDDKESVLNQVLTRFVLPQIL